MTTRLSAQPCLRGAHRSASAGRRREREGCARLASCALAAARGARAREVGVAPGLLPPLSLCPSCLRSQDSQRREIRSHVRHHGGQAKPASEPLRLWSGRILKDSDGKPQTCPADDFCLWSVNFLPLPPRIGRAKQARPSEGNAGEQASGKPSPAPARAPGEQRTRCSRT